LPECANFTTYNAFMQLLMKQNTHRVPEQRHQLRTLSMIIQGAFVCLGCST